VDPDSADVVVSIEDVAETEGERAAMRAD